MLRIRKRTLLSAFISFMSVPCLHAQDPSIYTWHNDTSRLGANLAETTLTLANVNTKTFGRVGFINTDGKVDAQVLYVAGQTIGGKALNVLYVATEHDSVYAYNAATSATLWHTSLLKSGETTSDDRGCGQITPEIGVTSTPVIDKGLGPHGAIYVVSMSKDSGGVYHQRINALDLSTGAQLFGGPTEVQASYPGTGAGSSGGKLTFASGQYVERAALLEWEGDIYTTWSSHCDAAPYTGWIMGYNATTLKQTRVFNVTPNGSDGGIWMAGAGPAANQNRIMLLDGNGSFDTTQNNFGNPLNGNFGNAFLNIIKESNGSLHVADYYATDTTVQQSAADTDLGSGGVMMLPNLYDNSGNIHYLAVGAGKDKNIYVVNRLNMGQYHANGGYIYQILPGALAAGAWSSPAYFHNKVYYAGRNDTVKAFKISNAKLEATPVSAGSFTFGYPGATPSISANNGNNGIVWLVNRSPTEGVLYAYNAENLSQELYDSNQEGSRDQFGPSITFTTPSIAAGKVYVGTPTGVAVFGLLQ